MVQRCQTRRLGPFSSSRLFPSRLQPMYSIKQQLVYIKRRKKKEGRTYGPNDAGRVIWARFGRRRPN